MCVCFFKDSFWKTEALVFVIEILWGILLCILFIGLALMLLFYSSYIYIYIDIIIVIILICFCLSFCCYICNITSVLNFTNWHKAKLSNWTYKFKWSSKMRKHYFTKNKCIWTIIVFILIIIASLFSHLD